MTGATDIVLIGPVTAGKSTISEALATRLGAPRISLDAIAERYYVEYGFPKAEFERVRENEGFLTAYRCWWPALAHATERVLGEYPDHIIDLGAGHTHYEDRTLFARVRSALQGRSNVVLLLPSSHLQRSIEVLRDRSIRTRGWTWEVDGYDFIAQWVHDPGNSELATLTVYTEGRTPAETCDEILANIGLTSA
jgi:hypothetical protein